MFLFRPSLSSFTLTAQGLHFSGKKQKSDSPPYRPAAKEVKHWKRENQGKPGPLPWFVVWHIRDFYKKIKRKTPKAMAIRQEILKRKKRIETAKQNIETQKFQLTQMTGKVYGIIDQPRKFNDLLQLKYELPRMLLGEKPPCAYNKAVLKSDVNRLNADPNLQARGIGLDSALGALSISTPNAQGLKHILNALEKQPGYQLLSDESRDRLARSGMPGWESTCLLKLLSRKIDFPSLTHEQRDKIRTSAHLLAKAHPEVFRELGFNHSVFMDTVVCMIEFKGQKFLIMIGVDENSPKPLLEKLKNTIPDNKIDAVLEMLANQ